MYVRKSVCVCGDETITSHALHAYIHHTSYIMMQHASYAYLNDVLIHIYLLMPAVSITSAASILVSESTHPFFLDFAFVVLVDNLSKRFICASFFIGDPFLLEILFIGDP